MVISLSARGAHRLSQIWFCHSAPTRVLDPTLLSYEYYDSMVCSFHVSTFWVDDMPDSLATSLQACCREHLSHVHRQSLDYFFDWCKSLGLGGAS